MSKIDAVFLMVFILILIALQNFPYYYNLSKTPAGHVYLGAERYVPDYYTFLSYIQQGAEGRMSLVNYYTSEEHSGSLAHVEYLISGKIGKSLGLSTVQIYMIFRSIALLIYVFASFWFIGLFIKQRLLKYFVLTLSFLWSGMFLREGSKFVTSFNFYQPPDVFNRLMFEPHKFLGISLFLAALYLLIKKGRKQIYLIFIVLITMGIIHGTSALSLLLTIGLYLLLLIIINVLNRKSVRQLLYKNYAMILAVVILVLPLMYWKIVFTLDPVWYKGSIMERSAVLIDMKEPFLLVLRSYLLLLSPLLIFTILGIKKFIKENDKLALFLLSFLISNMLFFFKGYELLFNVTRHRFYQTPFILGLLIVSAFGMEAIARRFKKKNLVLTIFFVFLIVINTPSIINSMKSVLSQREYNFGFIFYLPQKWHEGLVNLNKVSNYNDRVLALTQAGQVIPGVSGRRVFAGDGFATPDYNQRMAVAFQFFEGKMDLKTAKDFLKNNQISYVFYGPEEKNHGDVSIYKELLKPVFSNEMVAIYSTKF